MSASTANAAPTGRRLSLAWAARQRVVIALVLLILFGALRYEHFLGAYNVLSVLRYNSMFALTSLGMCFVIMGAGIDLSVGTTAAFASVVSALLSPYGLFPGLLGGLGAGLAVGVVNGFMVTRMNIQPFIATLSGMLVASGSGLLLAHNQSVSVSYDTDFTWLGQGDFLGFPTPAWIAAAAYVYGSVVLNFMSFGRYVLAVGGNEEAARLMGLPVDRIKFLTYVQSGVFAGLAGVILLPLRRSSAPASRRKASVGNCSRSPPSSSEGRCSPGASARWRRRSPGCCCSASSSTCSISRTALAGSASAPIGSRWCAASF